MYLVLAISPVEELPLGPLDGWELSATEFDRVQVGQLAPDFRLGDEQGDIHQLSQYRGSKNVILVFYRGHW
jgi:hypothetical protein